MIVAGAIVPHGNPVFEQPDGPTRGAMEELARRLRADDVEAAILVTPHGTHLDGHFGVVRSAELSEHGNQFVDAEHLYDGPGAPDLADACVRALQEDGLPALGMTFGTTAAGGSVMPVDWGAGIPLWFLRLPAVVVTPCRALSNDAHELLFWVLVALVALHAAAALYHHLFQHDATLTRMLPRRRGGPGAG